MDESPNPYESPIEAVTEEVRRPAPLAYLGILLVSGFCGIIGFVGSCLGMLTISSWFESSDNFIVATAVVCTIGGVLVAGRVAVNMYRHAIQSTKNSTTQEDSARDRSVDREDM